MESQTIKNAKTKEPEMIETVLKRDGRVVGFNEEKIAAAIRKAMLTTDEGDDANLISQITDRIAMRGKSQMTVEEIQDMVEMELMSSRPTPGRPKTCSTTILPATISAMIIPRKVITGIRALRSTCPYMTLRSLLPRRFSSCPMR